MRVAFAVPAARETTGAVRESEKARSPNFLMHPWAEGDAPGGFLHQP